MKKLLSLTALLAGTLLQPAPVRAAVIGEVVITKNMLEGHGGNCQNLDPEQTEDIQRYERLICEFHKFTSETDLSRMDARITSAQQLQRQGVTSSEQALLSMVEGILNCRKARSMLPSFGSLKAEKRVPFCDARASGMAALNSISWKHAHIAYSEDSGLDSTRLIDEISSCYDMNAGPMNPKWNDACDISKPLTADEQEAIVSAEYESAESVYFGGASPITQLFLEKKTMTDSVVAGMEGRQPLLEIRSTELGAKLQSLTGPFYSGIKDPKNPESPLDKMVNSYRKSYSTASAIWSRYEDWKNGLLIEKGPDGNGRDLSLDLIHGDSSALQRLNGAKKNLLGNGKDGSEIDAAIALISRLQDQKDAVRPGAQKLCAIYYCDLAVAAADQNLFAVACATSALSKPQKNPLCVADSRPLKSAGNSLSVKEFCSAAGFDTAAFGQLNMTEEQAMACTIPKGA